MDIGTLVRELTRQRIKDDPISFTGTFVHRKLRVPNRGQGITSSQIVIHDYMFGNLELCFFDDYFPKRIQSTRRYHQVKGDRGNSGHSFSTKDLWRLYDPENTGDLAASSLIVPTDVGFEDTPFVWAPVVEMTRPRRVTDIPLKMAPQGEPYEIDGGQVRIYSKVLDGSQRF